MADTESQEKTKKKKKGTGSTKEKEPKKKTGAESDAQPDAKTPAAAPETKTPPAAAATPETKAPAAATSEPVAAADEAKDASKQVSHDSSSEQMAGEMPKKGKNKSKSSTKEQPKAEEPADEKGNGSPKPFVAEGGSRKSSVVEASTPTAGTSRKTSANDEKGFPTMPDEMIQPTYVVPPAATKRDIDLLVDMDETKLLELKEAFELFDYNQDGYIDWKDLKLTYQTLGQADVPDDDITNMLAEAITPLDFDAFVILLGYKTIEMDPETVLVEALSCWDYENSGLISEDRIKHDLMTWGDKFTKEEADMALEDAPVYVSKKGISMIDYMKFCNTLSGLRKKTKIEQEQTS